MCCPLAVIENFSDPAETGVIVICVSPGCVFPRTHIPRDACFSAHISLNIHILQVIVMRVSPGILFPHHLYADFDAD